MYGRGMILRIDLTSEEISKEPISEELSRKYLGGEGINDYLLWEHFLNEDIRSDPLGPDNVLICGLGPLGATGYEVGSKMKWTYKSPQTDAFGDGSCGGLFGSTLRWAGYDHLVITGKAKRPAYIWIKDDMVEIRDGSRIWGKSPAEVDDILKEEQADGKIATASMGIAAENLVRYAPIICSPHRSAGKTGSGTVMASKNLKAIAVSGTRGIDIYDPEGLLEACDALSARLNEDPKLMVMFRKHGTHLATEHINLGGWSSLRNSQISVIPEEKMEKLSCEWFEKNMKVAELACSPSCAIGCDGIVEIKGNETEAATRYKGTYSRPEYTAVGGFGTVCDIGDWAALTYLWNMCNKYGIDTMEIAVCVGFLMELWQRGIVTLQDTIDWFGEPVPLEWGSYVAAEKVIDSLALQKNKIGEILTHGVFHAAKVIGEMKNVPVLKYAIYGKFGVGHIEDLRNSLSWGTGFAVASRGCDHLKAYVTPDRYGSKELSMSWFGTPEAAELDTTTLKGASTALGENRQALANCLGACVFVVNRKYLVPTNFFSSALAAITGIEMTDDELDQVGKRTVNLEKAFNSRLGYRRDADKLCERWTKERKKEGPGKGWRASDWMDQTLDEYYEYHGWDKKTSLQTRKRLEELDMEDVADVLEKDGALA